MALKAATLDKTAKAMEQDTIQIYSRLFSEKTPANAKGLRYKAEAKIKFNNKLRKTKYKKKRAKAKDMKHHKAKKT